ncbi:MAG: Nif3-like dinuclear metal center hexameric protein [Ignavibacteriae bacterium]|nr:MAG: Nif3-like dinuclear metal center hexameric protein [Ignavibacteriota bacterium]
MSLQVLHIVQWFEEWAPAWVSSEKDHVGLQVGNLQNNVTKIVVALDVNRQIINEAIAQKAELIVTHHPLLYRMPSAITTNNPVGDMVLQLAEHKIALFSAHTNLDYAPGGVSFALADILGLQNIRFLSPLKNSLAKIVVFVPEGYADNIRNAMSEAGAGHVGEYSSCSFGSHGRGSFYGSSSAHPVIGSSGTLEFVDELRLEMVAPRAALSGIVAALKAVHPYEEPAYDIYPVENPNPNFGMGAVGELLKPQQPLPFLKFVKQSLGAKALRYTGNTTHKIRRVAVCGGAGSDHVNDARSANADALVTADIRYHTFQSAPDDIILIDAGHWETEQIILHPIAGRLRSAARAADEPLTVMVSKHTMNPIKTM